MAVKRRVRGITSLNETVSVTLPEIDVDGRDIELDKEGSIEKEHQKMNKKLSELSLCKSDYAEARSSIADLARAFSALGEAVGSSGGSMRALIIATEKAREERLEKLPWYRRLPERAVDWLFRQW